MLSDEEKKVVEWLKQSINEYNDIFQGKIEDESGIKRMKTIKNLIEKQSKEIEHWKAGMKIVEKDKNNHIERLERKIKELDSQNEVLEEIKTSYEKKTDKLLKEKVKKEKEIEELKEKNKTLKNLQNDTNGLYIEMIERKNYFERELQKLEAKIKAKIEESELLIDNSQGCMSDEDLYKEYGKIEFGQSLLEKE